MRVVAYTGRRGRLEPDPDHPRFEIRHNDAKRYRRRGEARYAWVMVDHWTHRVCGYFKTKRLAELELARRKEAAR